MSASFILVVNEIESEREEIARALDAEGFKIVQASSAASAVREIWEGSFIAAVIPTLLTGTSSSALSSQLHQMAPEIETVVHGKNDDLARLVRKICEIRDGVAAA
jgi:DNA-binding NtrC family response regulator